jgi:serine/threonine protein kinase
MADLQRGLADEDSLARAREGEATLDAPVPSSPEPKWTDGRGPSVGDELIGQIIADRWVVERKLGQGGMGVVYAARHTVIDRRLALKVLRADLGRDPQIRARFVQEAKAASHIGNPHICEVSDFGELPDGSTYFAMELLVGRSLADTLDEHPRTPLPVPRLVHIALQVARGLGAAHDAGIVHRDLKPDNVMLVARGSDADFVKVLDFGIAKVGFSAERVTRAGQVFGTPHYMSPEQAEGKAVDARTDIYALGVMLFEMASGRVPFDADNFMGILTQHLYKEPPSLRETAAAAGGNVPEALDAIVRKCMAKKAAQRYLTMDEVGADLERLATGGTPLAVASVRQLAAAASGRSFAQTGYAVETMAEIPMPGDEAADSSGRPTLTRKRARPSPLVLGLGSGLLVAISALGWATTRRPPEAQAERVHADVPVAATPLPASSAVSVPLPSAAATPSGTSTAASPASSSSAVAAPVDAGKPRAAAAHRGGGPKSGKPKCNIEDPGCDPWQ